MKKRIVSVLLTTVLWTGAVTPLTGCGEKKGGEETKQAVATVVEDKYIVEEGISDYYVVLPKEPMEKETYAAQEFASVMRQATGCNIETISEKQVKGNDKYVSIGNTAQFQAACPGVDLSSIEDTYSSYFITTVDDNIYIVSGDKYEGEGSLYGAYDLLHELVGYTYYHDTEIHVEEKKDVPLLAYDNHFETPSFDFRCVSTLYNYMNDTHNTRLRFINFSKGKEWNDDTIGHGAIQVYVDPNHIDPADPQGRTYFESHKDWFINSNGDINPNVTEMIDNQLCMTAGEELEALIAEKLIGFINADPEATFFMFGQEDCKMACKCARCLAAMEEWGGTAGGLQVAFMNNVIERVEAWLEENAPTREIVYVIYAYHATEAAPIKQDAKGNIIPYSDKVIPHEKLRVMLCPVNSNFAYSLDSPVNSEFDLALKGWANVAFGKLYIYSYDLNVSQYFGQFNSFAQTESWFKYFKEHGASFVLPQGVSDTSATCFDELRTYVASQLLWNVEQSYDALAYDFIEHYYKEASEPMAAIYQNLRDQYAYYQTAVDLGSGGIWGNIYSKELYTQSFVAKQDGLIKEALAAIEPLQETDAEKYTLLKNRIMKEYLSVIYFKVVYYSTDYEDEMSEMKEIWEYYINYFGISAGSEGGVLPEIFK